MVIILLSTLFLLAVFFNIFGSHPKQHASLLRSSSSSDNNSNNNNNSLCEIKVCSHQILNAPSSSDYYLPDGSLQAMDALWEASINCFDIDIVTLKDGTLLTAHPKRFADALIGSVKQRPEEYTLAEARSAGIDAVGFPILEDVLSHFANLVKTTTITTTAHNDNTNGLIFRQGGVGPLLNLDLKGPNLTVDHVNKLEEIITEQGILGNVAVCATALENNDVGPGVDLLNILGMKRSIDNNLFIGIVLRDRVVEENNLERVSQLIEQYPAIELIVPSNKFDVQYFHSLKKHVQKPITSWTVDDEEGLAHAIQSGLDDIISNHPIEMNDKLQAMKKGQCNTSDES
jgi:glycerophosphoryl diester phosphodiesterase